MAASLAAISPLTPPAPATLRQPIAVVRLDGQELPGVRTVRVGNCAHYAADTFRVELALQDQPVTSDWSAWGGQNTLSEIEVLFGLIDPAMGQRLALQSAIIGPVDKIEIEQPENRVHLTGRDYSSVLIDAQSFESFENKLASDVATELAERHGLMPVVTATTTPIGQFSPRDNAYTGTTVRQSEWDLLARLARSENYDVFIRGRSLFFQPPSGPAGPPYPLIWTASSAPGTAPRTNVERIRLTRLVPLARDLTVTVASHDALSGSPILRTATSVLAGQTARGAALVGPQQYTVDVPGLTAAQAAARAQKLISDFGRQERLIEVEMPGDPLLTIDSPIILSGTGTGWDQLYLIDRIDRELSLDRGFTMHLSAKNRSSAASVTSS
jgi:phage protein D